MAPKTKYFLFGLISFLVGSVPAHDDDQQCSSAFHSEYKVLQRLSELETVQKQQSEMIKELKSNQASQHKVAFSAYMSAEMTGIASFVTIVFDNVTTNIGGAYNGKSGIFACYQPGVYVFYWVTSNDVRSSMDSQLVVNGMVQCQAFSDAYDHNDYAVASNAIVLSLQQGDQVWIRSGNRHNGKVGGERMTSFSGWLLYSN